MSCDVYPKIHRRKDCDICACIACMRATRIFESKKFQRNNSYLEPARPLLLSSRPLASSALPAFDAPPFAYRPAFGRRPDRPDLPEHTGSMAFDLYVERRRLVYDIFHRISDSVSSRHEKT